MLKFKIFKIFLLDFYVHLFGVTHTLLMFCCDLIYPGAHTHPDVQTGFGTVLRCPQEG